MATLQLGQQLKAGAPRQVKVQQHDLRAQAQQVRQRLSVEQFRLAVFWALLLTGVYTFASRLL